MPGILACTALLLLSASSSYPQWERVVLAWTGVDDPLRPITHGSPHPLQYYRRPSPERDPINSLNLGERVGTHQISLQDYVVQTSQRPLGEPFGRKIIEIVLTLRHGSEMQTMEAEGSEQGDSCKDVPSPSVEEPRDVQWRSVVMESSPRAYLELYLLINNGMFDRSQSKASVYSVEGSQILEVAAYLNAQLTGNTDFCEGSYWILRNDGPQRIDLSAVENEVKRVIPQDATLIEPRCGAIDMKELELRSPVQRTNTECHACGFLGGVTVRFRLDGHRAIPGSSSFETYQEP